MRKQTESVFARVSMTDLNNPQQHMYHPFRGAVATVIRALDAHSIAAGCTNGAVFAVVFGRTGLFYPCFPTVSAHPHSADDIVELREATVMQRLWAGLVPGRSAAAAAASVASLDVWSLDSGPLVAAAYTDGSLRLWSIARRTVVGSATLAPLLGCVLLTSLELSRGLTVILAVQGPLQLLRLLLLLPPMRRCSGRCGMCGWTR
jgi:hypothetical protein